ncbi:XkdX family protein [Clostridium tyrobutyricum]|uniref:XkdX family protein n=1 Tax=Clostridium tyrobutyricum TaxID=1519 RepID=UPI001C38EBC5|nr:XkdX family protein [Clostridium tyrobutyricum]MBV4423255.1 XkdX family protein [Clostridium tyrobutyricum]
MTNLEKVQFLYNTQNATKDDVFNYVKSNTITREDYKIIVGEDCPELPLDAVIQNKVQELEIKCLSIISNGFDSNCLGDTKHFDSTQNDIGFIQGLASKASLIKGGATLQDNTLDWKASDEAVCHPFTADQMIALGVDLSTFMTTNIKKKEQLQAYVKTLTEAEYVQGVTWDTQIPTT